MGLDINAVRFLIQARQQGVQFGEVLTLGRQDLNVYPKKMAEVFDAHGLPSQAFKGEDKVHHAEPCFLALGAKKVHSMDVSAFEGAEFVHDLNQLIGPELKERFDVVYDGGTLEHVFNFPMALKNCMEMTRVGGQLFLHTIANNYCGHGFYQFSPELFFRALGAENGFKIESMIVHRVGPYGRWYEVSDPEQIRSRVEVITFSPLQLLLRAKRVAAVPIFERTPQQSDYTPRWTGPVSDQPTTPQVDYTPPRPFLSKYLPAVARLLHVIKIGFRTYKSMSLWNRKCFRPVNKP